MMYTYWGLESILESIEDRNWSVYGLEADGEKHPHEVFLKRGNKKISVFHKKDGIYVSPRKNVVFDSNTGIVNEYHGNKLHMTSYAHLSSPLGFRQVVELSKHPKKTESHLPAIRSSGVPSNLAEDTHLARTHLEQIKHILVKATDEEDIKRSVPQLKHHLEEIKKIADKVLKENHGLKDREKWERLHDDAVKFHEFVDEGDFSKLRRSLKMASHTERETPSHDERRTMYGDHHDNVSDTPFMDRGQRRITHDRNSKPGKAARDAEVEKKAMAEMDRLRKEEELRKEHEKWRGKGALVALDGKKEEAARGLSESKKGLSLAHKLALGGAGVAAAGALGWATKGRGKAAVKAAEKGWSTGRKAAVGAASVVGAGTVGYGSYRATHSDKHRR